MNIQLGTKLTATYGAYSPVIDGHVAEVKKSQCLIWWDDNSEEWININEVRAFGETTVNGSPIGIHLAE